jgi:transposase InsO family protein
MTIPPEMIDFIPIATVTCTADVYQAKSIGQADRERWMRAVQHRGKASARPPGWPVILDIYSRYVAGWMAATRESAALAEKLIAATCAKQGITRRQLSIHVDRGSSMTSKPVALLLAGLGVTQSRSRPHLSNDNPYSEAQFKTLEYRPAFPARFPSIEAARAPRRPRPGPGCRLPRPPRTLRPQTAFRSTDSVWRRMASRWSVLGEVTASCAGTTARSSFPCMTR